MNHNFYRIVAQSGNPQFRSILGNFIDGLTDNDITAADYQQMQNVVYRYENLFEQIFKKDRGIALNFLQSNIRHLKAHDMKF